MNRTNNKEEVQSVNDLKVLKIFL